MVKYFILIVFISTQAFGIIRNYENSENLEKAKIYCPSYAQDRSLVDRDKAIEHYLLYLKEYPDSINRAKVLTRIGMLYAQYKDREKKISPNYDLATKYFKEAIEVDPDFICYETIVARTNLASIAEHGDKRFESRLQTCKWLQSISIDKIKASVEIEAKHLINKRASHDLTDEQEREMEQKLNSIESDNLKIQIKQSVHATNNNLNSIKRSTETNLLYDAFVTSSPEASLKRIIQEFEDVGGIEIVERAKLELDKIMTTEVYFPEIGAEIKQETRREIIESEIPVTAGIQSKEIEVRERAVVAEKDEEVSRKKHDRSIIYNLLAFMLSIFVIFVVVKRLVVMKRD